MELIDEINRYHRLKNFYGVGENRYIFNINSCDNYIQDKDLELELKVRSMISKMADEIYQGIIEKEWENKSCGKLTDLDLDINRNMIIKNVEDIKNKL